MLIAYQFKNIKQKYTDHKQAEAKATSDPHLAHKHTSTERVGSFSALRFNKRLLVKLSRTAYVQVYLHVIYSSQT